ncbi:uridine phosphorylase 1 [Eurytemora carolleeae]|uniref:uridine phosphorylase 1 n=1 Tax=Eurytemora carolleeae TaxID=1294199 RepID=UPI000C771D1A|nr:uridine phosphorylase 1 [Eurytemora carolleeae]|eukprot:XP_023333543.1 uridine phosphorylase 1-like [Eurytemora affinis]
MAAKGRTISEREGVKLMNPHIQEMEEDVLYHLALGSGSHDLRQMFGDVRFVCMGGTPHRMQSFAEYMVKELGYILPTGTDLVDISARSHRLLTFQLIRIGTCGGIGLPPGSVVVTEEAFDGQLRPVLDTIILGKVVSRPCKLDQNLADKLTSMSDPEDEFKTVKGKTISTDDFYEGQGRLDGAICEYTEKDKMAYLNHVSDNGVVNMEMEATVFAAMTHMAGIRAAVVCVTLLDRLKGDQVLTPKEELIAWQERPQKIVARFILSELSMEERQAATPTMSKLARISSNLFAKSYSCFEDA